MDILLLENDPLVAELVELVLSGTIVGEKVRHTYGVAEAKAAWSQQPAQLVASQLNTPIALRMLRQSGVNQEKWATKAEEPPAINIYTLADTLPLSPNETKS